MVIGLLACLHWQVCKDKSVTPDPNAPVLDECGKSVTTTSSSSSKPAKTNPPPNLYSLVGHEYVLGFGVRLAVDGHGSNSHFPARLNHTTTNLASVSNQQFVEKWFVGIGRERTPEKGVPG